MASIPQRACDPVFHTDDSYVVSIPSDGDAPKGEDLFCWECGNSLDPDTAISVPIEFEGEPLRVPMCPVCAPSESPHGRAFTSFDLAPRPVRVLGRQAP